MQMNSGGSISIDEVDPAKGLYRVSIMNAIDIGWDGDNHDDRIQAAKIAMKGICQDSLLVSETKIPMGHYLLGRERIKFVMTMQCPKIN